ncbi:MAG: SMI1/KNR4 family protein [Saccharothrix sp.]|nr:SMI1/KNR4 family protein [Saccharothrix sp.]
MADRDLAEIERFVAALVEMGIARPETVEGCSADEIGIVLERAGRFDLPVHYVAFLELLGRKAGRLFRGTDIYFPEPIDANDYAEEFSRQGDPGFSTAGRFFFATHQGYQLYYFDQRSPGVVFMHTEGRPDDEALAPSFLEFLWTTARGEAASSTTGLRDEHLS